MIALNQFITISRTLAVPVYIQIADGIAALIERQVLFAGMRIQGTRELAQAVKVHRKTVVMAYGELLEQGWITTKPRQGYFVSMTPPRMQAVPLSKSMHTSAYAMVPNFKVYHRSNALLMRKADTRPFRYKFNDGFPDVRLAPMDALLAEYSSIGKRKLSRQLLSYSAKEGSPKLREALATDLRHTRGMPVSAGNILVTRGAQQAMSLVTSFLIKPGETIVVGNPNYFAANLLFERHGAKLVHLPVDEAGIDVELLEKVCRRRKVRMVYVIPHHHHPTTVTLSPERRLKLLSLAEAYKFVILEDDFDFDIHFANKPVLPMASVDRSGSVVYVGTLAKILAPAIRIGYIAGPEKFIELLAQHKFLVDMQGDTLMEHAVAELYRNGILSRHLKKVRRIYRERRDYMAAFLRSELPKEITFRNPEGGMSIWTTFNRASTEAVSAIAAEKGLFLCDGRKHRLGGQDFNGVSLGFASMNTPELQDSLNILQYAVTRAIAR